MLLIFIHLINLTTILATLRSTFTDHFQQDKFTTFNLLTRFQSSTQLQLEIYYHVKKLTMEEKIIAAIQHIRSKSKQRVTSQRIFRFINKGAVSIGCELFQDCINSLEIDGRIYIKRGVKMLPFLLIPLPRIAKKMMSRTMWKKLINLLNHLKQLKNWNLLLPSSWKFLKPNTKYAYNKYTSALSKR